MPGPGGRTLRGLDIAGRAQVFAQLAAMERAGLAPARAFSALAAPGSRVAAAARCAAGLISKGSSLVHAGRRCGVFDEIDARVIDAAERAGSPQLAYERLAAYHGGRARRRAAVKARLVMPLFVLVVALLVAPLPALVAGRLEAGEYLVSIIARLAVLAAGAWALLRLPVWLRGERAAGLGLAVAFDSLLLRLPVLGPYLRRRDLVAFLETLSLGLDAGVPAFDAVPLAAGAVPNRILRRRARAVGDRLEAGAALDDAIAAHPDLDARAGGFFRAGVATGDVASAIEHFLHWERRALDDHAARIAEWAPRIIYALVMAWLAWHVIGGWLQQLRP